MRRATLNTRRSYRQSESKELRRVDAQSPKNVESRPQTAKTSGDRRKILPFRNVVRLSPWIYSVVFRCRFFYPLPRLDADITNPEGNSQSVSLSKESYSFPIRTLPFFPFFTRDKESIEAQIRWESGRREKRRDADGKTSLHEAIKTKGKKEGSVYSRSILHFAIPILVPQRCIVWIAANGRKCFVAIYPFHRFDVTIELRLIACCLRFAVNRLADILCVCAYVVRRTIL